MELKLSNKKNYVLVLFIILLSDDTLLFGTNSNQFFIIFRYVAYGLLVFLTLFTHGSNYITKKYLKSIKIFSILVLAVILSSLYNNDFMTGNFLMLFTLLTSIVLTRLIGFLEFQKYFVNLIYFFSICSLILYLINILLPSFISFLPVITNFGEVSFRTILFSNVFSEGNQFRNPGIFREPGVFAIYLNFALIFILFFKKEKSFKKIIVLILTLLSTLSTAGILVFFLVLLLYFFKERSFKNFFISVTLGLITFSVFTFFPAVYDGIFAKLNTSDKDYLSSLSRLASLLTPLEIIKQNPYLGVGLTKFVTYYEKFSLQLVGFTMKADSSSTNTFLNTLAIFGGIFGGVMIKYYYNFCKLITKNYAFLLLIIIFVMFSSQDLRYSLLYLILFSYGTMYYNIKK